MDGASSSSSTAWWREPTRGQWASFAAAWIGWVLDAFDFTVFLLVMPLIGKEFHVGITATAGSITLTLLVRLLGGAVAGWAADRWGRKLPLMISVVWFAVCDGLVGLAPSFLFVLVVRTIFGFGMGAEWTSGATLAMENWPARSRGIASGILQGSWAIGYLAAATAAAFVVPRFGWRALFLLAAAPALLALPIRAWVPESTEWKRAAEAAPNKASWSAMLRAPGLVRRLAWASVAMAAGFGAYYALTGVYAPLLVKEHGLDLGGIAKLVALFNVGMLLGSVATGWLAARRGVVAAVVVPALAMCVAMPLYVGLRPELLGVGAFLGGALGAGYAGTTPLLLTSLFPAAHRARAVGLVYHLGAFGAAFVPVGIAALAEHEGLLLSHSLGLVAGACELVLALCLLLGPRDLGREAAESSAPAGEPALLH
ncbi:MAG TPA: MFS transporter [Minicystis sp.]|nr:MFS transporter [Minicystis sp.]